MQNELSNGLLRDLFPDEEGGCQIWKFTGHYEGRKFIILKTSSQNSHETYL